jgi:molybdate transport system regulatory protein
MGMSYRRAWLLVDEINQIFREPLVEKQMGGSGGGGARLTRLGREVVDRYRAIEGAAATASSADVRALKAALSNRPAGRGLGDG